MSLEQHTSIIHAESFAPHAFFLLPIGENDNEMLSIDSIMRCMERSQFYRQKAHEILDKARTGWTRAERGIPEKYWETVGAHMLKVSLSAWKILDGLPKWYLRSRKAPPDEILKLSFDMEARMRMIRKGFFHDFQEWGSNPDITPGQMTKEEQDKIEYEAMLEYARLFGDDYPLKMYLSMRGLSLENKILFHLDKMDAAVMALNYERDVPGCDVSEFFPYTFSKFSLPMMGEILQTLIDHKGDYPNDFFVQYDSLLFHGGNKDAWRYEMDMRASGDPAWELVSKLERHKRRYGDSV